MSSGPIYLSLVIPVYNEEASLPELFAALRLIRDTALCKFGTSEIIFVNDGSYDRSWALIESEVRHDVEVIGINLSRNFGHQAALMAGMDAARGEVIITLDADLQDPPTLIPELLNSHRDGYDVVHATRRTRGNETWLKRNSARVFYWIMGRLSGVPIPRDTGDFRLLSRRALCELQRLPEMHRFLRGLVPWIGLPQTQVFYDRATRHAGSTHFTFGKMCRLGVDGATSMSTVPLKLPYYFGLGAFVVLSGYIAWVLVHHFLGDGPLEPGWLSLISAITILATGQLFLMGIFGEYIGRIYEQVKQRPHYIVQDVTRRMESPVPTSSGCASSDDCLTAAFSRRGQSGREVQNF